MAGTSENAYDRDDAFREIWPEFAERGTRIAALEAENAELKAQKGRWGCLVEIEAENGRLTVRLAEAERVLRFVAKHPHVTNPRAIARYFAAQSKDKPYAS